MLTLAQLDRHADCFVGACITNIRYFVASNPRLRPYLFDAYSCVLLESARRFNARAATHAPAKRGMVLVFEAATSSEDIEDRLEQITAKCNGRLAEGVTLVALRND